MAGKSIANNLSANLASVHERIRAACNRSGRDLSSVKLVAVSKGQPAEKLHAAIQSGQRRFGENYVQEATLKLSELGEITRLASLEWHFIGTLQSNKVKQVIGRFGLIHSVDRDSLLAAIAKAAVAAGYTQDILLEVNLAGETSKGGARADGIEDLLRKARDLPGVRVRGLMGLPPAGSPEQSRPHFRTLRELLEKWRTEDFCELSMGTSQDFEAAIEEGATLVRIGTEIFGRRERRT